MSRQIKEVNLALTRARCDKFVDQKTFWKCNARTKRIILHLPRESWKENFAWKWWMSNWLRTQLWWLVHKQHHPKTKDWNSYNFTVITEQQKAWLIDIY